MAKEKPPTDQNKLSNNTSMFPPGLANHTNTCFFNSTLQALISTSLLENAIRSRPTPIFHFPLPLTPLQPQQSPALAQRRNNASITPSMTTMPLCHEFIGLLEEAYAVRDSGSRKTLSPRSLLMCLGSKFGQYLDFRQQDAHELLRQLLDAMEMEEKDEIKRRKQAAAAAASPGETKEAKLDPSDSSPEDALYPFVEMLFEGQLTSILVCDGCHHISQSFENFMDLSLSLKQDERERKRDRLLQFVQRMKKAPASIPTIPSPPASTPASTAIATPIASPIPRLATPSFLQVETPRSQSVPPGSPFKIQALVESAPHEPRRLSDELTPEQAEVLRLQAGGSATSLQPPSPASQARDDDSVISQPSSELGKLGKRLSVKLGLMTRDKPRGRGDRSKDSMIPNGSEAVPAQVEKERRSTDSVTPLRSRAASPLSRAASQTRITAKHHHFGRHHTKTKEERKAAYLKALLRDIPSHSHASPWDLISGFVESEVLHKTTSGQSTDGIHHPILEPPRLSFGEKGLMESLRQFTDVEVLDGVNSFACKRCWKKANPKLAALIRKEDKKADSSSDESDLSDSETPPVGRPIDSFTSTQRKRLDPAAMPLPLSRPPSPFGSTHPANTVGPNGFVDQILPVTPPAAATQTTGSELGTEIPFESSSAASSAASLSAIPSIRVGSSDDENGVAPSTVEPDGSLPPTSASSTPAPTRSPSPIPAVLPPKAERVMQTKAFKRYLISAPPPVLVIHFKRFQQITRTPVAIFGTLRKVEDFIPFPEWLDLRNFMAPRMEDFGLHSRKAARANPEKPKTSTEDRAAQVMYRLYAVVVHIGSMLGGHYVAYTALPSDLSVKEEPTQGSMASEHHHKRHSGSIHAPRKWCFVSDTSVRSATLEEVLKAKAYLLFYERIR